MKHLCDYCKKNYIDASNGYRYENSLICLNCLESRANTDTLLDEITEAYRWDMDLNNARHSRTIIALQTALAYLKAKTNQPIDVIYGPSVKYVADLPDADLVAAVDCVSHDDFKSLPQVMKLSRDGEIRSLRKTGWNSDSNEAYYKLSVFALGGVI